MWIWLFHWQIYAYIHITTHTYWKLLKVYMISLQYLHYAYISPRILIDDGPFNLFRCIAAFTFYATTKYILSIRCATFDDEGPEILLMKLIWHFTLGFEELIWFNGRWLQRKSSTIVPSIIRREHRVVRPQWRHYRHYAIAARLSSRMLIAKNFYWAF